MTIEELFAERFPIWSDMLESINELEKTAAINCFRAFKAGYELVNANNKYDEVEIDHLLSVKTPASLFKDANACGGVNKCFDRGFKEFENRVEREESAEVLRDFEISYAKYRGAEFNWTLVLSRRSWVMLTTTAKEYSISPSTLAQWCIIKGILVAE